MKKSAIALLIALSLCFLTIFASACGATMLNAPKQFELNDNYRLYWETVENANGYNIEILNVASGEKTFDSIRQTNYRLDKMDEGDYEVKVKSVGRGYEDSAWSETIYFHRDHETGCIYTLINNDSEYEVSSIGAASGDVELGDVYRGKNITSIGAGAFNGKDKLHSVVIGKYVTVINQRAFFNCGKLVSVTFPDALEEICKSAFHSCNMLTSVNLSENVRTIGEAAFQYCRALEEVKMPGVQSLGSSVFANCTALKTIEIPSSVTKISDYAFYSSGLTSFNVGAQIESIDGYAFHGCKSLTEVEFAEDGNLTAIRRNAFSSSNLEAVELPNGVESIGYQAFAECAKLSEVSIPESVTEIGAYAFDQTALYLEQVTDDEVETLVYVDNWLVSTSRAVQANTQLLGYEAIPNGEDAETLIIREGTVGIASMTFYENINLRQVRLPSSVKYIGSYAFMNCKELWAFWSLTKNGNILETIGSCAFLGCESLYDLVLNNGLKSIGSQAFYKCTALNNNSGNANTFIPDTLESIGAYAFYTTALYSEASNDVVYAGNWVVGYKGAPIKTEGGLLIADEADINLSKVRGIADYAFAGAAIRSVIGLSEVRYIGEGAFYGCERLASVSLNSSISEIAPYTFYGCKQLYSIEMPVMLSKIGRSAFYGCKRLSNVDLSVSVLGVKEIDDFAFSNCTNLRKYRIEEIDNWDSAVGVNLGNTVERIGNYAFYNCSYLDEIILPDSVKTVGEGAFRGCSELTYVGFGSNVNSLGDSAFAYCSSLQNVVLSDSVINVGRYAFYKCTELKTVNLGGVKSIGDFAFAGSYNLTEVVFPKGLKTIGNQAFRGCAALAGITLPSGIEKTGVHAFYTGTALTIYAQDESCNEYWSGNWNSLFRPVVWNVELSDEGFVVSFTVTETSFSNPIAVGGISEPRRSGYTFLGWAESENGEPVYSASEVASALIGTTLYAVWQER